MSLNESQSRAIAVGDGPAIILAGAGSGKTTVITHRIKSLIENHHISPSNILVITFTKAAAGEMKERFLKLTKKTSTGVTFGTFHAVFFMVLKLAYRMTSANILSEDKKFQLIRDLIVRHRLDARDEADVCNNLIADISRVKNGRINPENFYSGVCGESVFRDIYREYNGYLKRNRLLDFDDMLTYTLELFQARHDILSAWQNKYRYILIDEFQDINQIQFDIIKMMAMPHNNLFVVGDDDQAIYRFRGSKPQIMLGFKKVYPDAQEILLDYNYRSDKQIVDLAMKLVGHNRVRFQKNVIAARPMSHAVFHKCFQSEEHQNKFIAETIRQEVASGGKFDDYAILFRTNTGPRQLMEEFLNYDISFRSRDKIPSLFEHWIAKDIRTYIRLAAGSRERRDVLAIMNKPLRYLSRDSLPEEQVAFDVWERTYDDKPWMAERIVKLESDLRLICGMNPYAAINYIRRGVGYDDYIISYAEEKGVEKEDLFRILDELLLSAKGFSSFREWNEHIRAFEDRLEEMNRSQANRLNAVTFSTLHSAKGLEYSKVFIINVNEGVIPYKKAVLEEDIEEERRLFYVGMTRAKDELTLCSVKDTINYETMPSQFLDEIFDDL